MSRWLDIARAAKDHSAASCHVPLAPIVPLGGESGAIGSNGTNGSRHREKNTAAPTAEPGQLVTLLRVPEDCPEEWVDGIQRLLAMPPPSSYSGLAWAVLRDDAAEFFWKWSGEAARLGWTTLAVWGVHPTRPQARTDCIGLVPILKGRRVATLTAVAAVIGRLQFYRPELTSEAVPLWEL